MITLSLLIISAAALITSRPVAKIDHSANPVITGLLHNIYHAFDYRDESMVYDLLEQSISGDLLEEIYLKMRRSLELDNQGGARAKVKAVTLEKLTAHRLDGDIGFIADATWRVTGSVGHWGHVHQRVNQYQAQLRIQSIDRRWKLTGLEIFNEERL